MDIDINNEGDIINLIGVDTVMKFIFVCDGIIAFKTIKPILVDGAYYNFEIDFFIDEEDDCVEFFCYSSFSDFLIKYKIYQLKYSFGDVNAILYERRYDE